MERQLTKLIENHISQMKQNIKTKMEELNIPPTPEINALFQYIYDYEKLEITKKDITKRTRAKNIVPLCNRCTARRANGEQCTRRRKDNNLLCGTHIKGTPHGIIETNTVVPQLRKITVWAEDIKGIIYFIDEKKNVYDPQDIHHNVQNPKIIAKWEMNNGEYVIPQFKN